MLTPLKPPSTFWTNLTAGIANGALTSLQTLPGDARAPGGLRLIRPNGFQEHVPVEYVSTSSAIAAMINTSTGALTPPGGFGFAWLEVPQAWLAYLLGTSPANCPTSGPMQFSPDGILLASGGWENTLQSLGFTPATPSTSGPIPALAN